ncbi:SpaA isopeptide-forming pilin-related protein [Streptomyces sp. H39-C1]|uniref:SpaA isopeptide-forming pilin-related protein n=1 Tax=Streptomyces sp. H39-C1 TaxID=3004355 RepID=UPI0022AE8310|nr:SpaA isopeptide-forming pilin-related protein [Streptomyces sp. H39-C1]MCZ4102902.1 SpaA isopeptide-forming pilin-related protein [Streptomyces sp. H39-C1]
MHARIARSAVRSAALVAAVTGTLTWAPAATAQPSEPTPSSTTSASQTPAADAGSVAITTNDAAGDALPGAGFLLLDATGQEAGRGTTDAQGKVLFNELAPGVYRLKETSSGSPLHDVVADQDVIVTPGATTRLTITDPFKAATVLLQVKDEKTGKFLPGATVNIGNGDKILLVLTTGPTGTAGGELPVTSRSTTFWVKQIKAPAGYDIYKPAKTFTAGPGALVTVTVTTAKTATVPKPDPSGKPTDKPTAAPSTPGSTPSDGGPGGSTTSPTHTSTPAADSSLAPATDPRNNAVPPTAPVGSLARTGAGSTPWVLGGSGLLVAAGGATILGARRRRTTEPEQNNEAESN